jgi:hypothetical protein
MTDFAESWEKNGKAAIEIMFREDPSKYVILGSAFMPKEIDVTHTTNTMDDIPYADLDALIGAFRARLAASVAGIGRREEQTIDGVQARVLSSISTPAVLLRRRENPDSPSFDGSKSEREDAG